MKSTADKINDLLGLSDDPTPEEVAQKITESGSQLHESFDELKSQISDSLEEVDGNIAKAKENALQIASLDHAMMRIEKLISLSEDMFEHVSQNFMSSDLIDSELLHAAAAFMESLHINISEFISLYKEKQKQIEKLRIMDKQQQQKIELMNIKHQQTLDLLKFKQQQNAIDVDGKESNGSSMTQEEITKMLQNAGNHFALAFSDDDKENLKKE